MQSSLCYVSIDLHFKFFKILDIATGCIAKIQHNKPAAGGMFLDGFQFIYILQYGEPRQLLIN